MFNKRLKWINYNGVINIAKGSSITYAPGLAWRHQAKRRHWWRHHYCKAIKIIMHVICVPTLCTHRPTYFFTLLSSGAPCFFFISWFKRKIFAHCDAAHPTDTYAVLVLFIYSSVSSHGKYSSESRLAADWFSKNEMVLKIINSQ